MHKFQLSNLKKNVYNTICPPLIQKQLFWLQYDIVVSFFHFPDRIILTKDQGIFVPTLFTASPSNLEDTAIQIRKNLNFFRITSLFIK